MALDTWVIGAIINLIGSILINLGTNIIKYHYHKTERARSYSRPHATSSASPQHANSNAEPETSRSRSRTLSNTQSPRSKIWWTGFFVFTIGNITNFVSMGFAAQSLLAGLGSVQFISNVAFSSCVLKQQVTNRVLLATFAIVVGNMLIVVFASHESGKLSVDELWSLYSNTAYKVYMTVLLCLVVILYVFYKEYKKRIFREYPGVHGKVLAGHKLLPCAYAAISGIIGTQSVVLAKSSSELVRTSIAGTNQFIYPFTYLILTAWIGSMLFWLYRMNAALRKFDGVFIIPVLQVVWTLFSIIGGGIYFQEFNTFTPIQIALFTLGVLIVMFGVYLLAPQQHTPGQRVITSGEHSSDIGSRNSELYNLRASSSSYSHSASPPPFNGPTQIRLALSARHSSGHFHHFAGSQAGSHSGSVNNSGHQLPLGSGTDLLHSDSHINPAGYTSFINDARTSSVGSDIQYTDSPTHAAIVQTTTTTISTSTTPHEIPSVSVSVSPINSPQLFTVGPAATAHAQSQQTLTSRGIINLATPNHFVIQLSPSSPEGPHPHEFPERSVSYSEHVEHIEETIIPVPMSPDTSPDDRRSRAMSSGHLGFTMPTFELDQESATEEEDTS